MLTEIAQQLEEDISDLKPHFMVASSAEVRSGDLRLSLRRLDGRLDQLSELIHGEEKEEPIIIHPREAVNLSIRRNLFHSMTLPLAESDVLHDGNIRELFASICSQSFQCLVRTFLVDKAMPFHPDEAQSAVGRFVDLLTTSHHEENLIGLDYLLEIINQSLDKDTGGRWKYPLPDESYGNGNLHANIVSEEPVEGTGGSWDTTPNTKPKYSRLEKLMQGKVPVLDLVRTVLPMAIYGMNKIRWKPSLELDDVGKLHKQIRRFLYYLLQYILDQAQVHASLFEYFQFVAFQNYEIIEVAHEIEVKNTAAKCLNLLRTYIYGCVDYSFEAFDNAKLLFQEQPGPLTHETNTAAFQECSWQCHLTCSALEFMYEFGMIHEKHKVASIRSLWTLYTQVYLAARTATSPVEQAVDALVGLGQLTMALDYSPSNYIPLDNKMQLCLSITFLAALDMPSSLLEHEHFLSILEYHALENREVRHLVQGAVLHQCKFAFTAAKARSASDIKATTQIIKRLRDIGLKKPNKNGEPWDSFFKSMVSRSDRRTTG